MLVRIREQATTTSPPSHGELSGLRRPEVAVRNNWEVQLYCNEYFPLGGHESLIYCLEPRRPVAGPSVDCEGAAARLGAVLSVHSTQRPGRAVCLQRQHRAVEGKHVQISLAAVGKPEDNGFAERLMRTVNEEEVDLTEYRDFHDARTRIGQFLDDMYTRKRTHSSLGYLTPPKFEAQWRGQLLRSTLLS